MEREAQSEEVPGAGRTCLEWMHRQGGRAAAVFALGGLASVLMALEPLFLLVFTNEVVLKSNLDLLAGLVVSMVACAIAAQYAYGLAKVERARLGQAVVVDLRRRLFESALRHPPSSLATESPGRRLALGSVEAEALDGIHHALFFGTLTIVNIVGLALLCFWVDPLLSTLLLIPLVAAPVVGRFDRALRRRQSATLERQQTLVGFLEKRLAGVFTIQLFGREEHESARFAGLALALSRARVATETIRQAAQRGIDGLQGLLLVAILLWGGIRVIREGSLSLGALLAVYSFAELILREARDGFDHLLALRTAWPSLERILREVGVERDFVDPPGALAIDRCAGHLEVRHPWDRQGAGLVETAIRPGKAA